MSIRRPLLWGALAVPLVALGAGCATQSASFRPAPDTETTTISNGYRSAYYTIELQNRIDGTVKVWSQGGYHLRTEHEDVPVLDVRLSIRNDTDESMRLRADRTTLDLFTTSGEQLSLKEPFDEYGPDSIEPGAIEQYRLVYELPEDLQPGNVDVFDLNWSIGTTDGTFSRTTHFDQYSYANSVYAYRPYPYWGWGLGWGGYGYPYWWDNSYYWGYPRYGGRYGGHYGGHYRGAIRPAIPKSGMMAPRSGGRGGRGAPGAPGAGPRGGSRSGAVPKSGRR